MTPTPTIIGAHADVRAADSNPDTLVTLHLRIETADGPRTIIANKMARRDASLITDAIMASGHYALAVEAGVSLSTKDQISKCKQAMKRKPKPADANVVPIPKRASA